MAPIKANLRILVLNSCRKWIGEAAHCFDLCRQLKRRGHFAILGCRRGYALEKKAREAGLRVLPLSFRSAFSPLSDARDVLAIRRAVHDERIDLIHCHRGKDHWEAAAARALFGLAAPIVRTRHVVTPQKNHLFNRWLYRHAAQAVIGVSGKALESLGPLRRMLPPERIRVIYSAVDCERFRPDLRADEKRKALGAGPNDLLIGLIGRLQNIKGQHVFIEAARRVAAEFPQARFLLAGAGGEHKRRRLLRRAEEAGLGGRVILLGYVEDLAGLMACFDLGVVASLGSEGSSRVALEYMASGVPIVATRAGGIPELLREGELGALVETNDPEALAEAMKGMLRDREKRRHFAARGVEAARTIFSYGRWLTEIEEVYRSVLSLKPTPHKSP